MSAGLIVKDAAEIPRAVESPNEPDRWDVYLGETIKVSCYGIHAERRAKAIAAGWNAAKAE